MENKLIARVKTAVEIGAATYNWAKTVTAHESDGGEEITDMEVIALLESIGNVVLSNAGSHKKLQIHLVETPPTEVHPAHGV